MRYEGDRRGALRVGERCDARADIARYDVAEVVAAAVHAVERADRI